MLHFTLYAVIGLVVWGVYQKITGPTGNTTNTGEVTYYWAGAKQTTFGCATFPVEKPRE